MGNHIYTFATDGSDFTRVITGGFFPFWSPDGSQIAYTIVCLEPADGCGLAIADADGSNVREFLYGRPGPRHPGIPAIDEPAPSLNTTEPAGELLLGLKSWGPGVDPDFVEVALYGDGRVIWGIQ